MKNILTLLFVLFGGYSLHAQDACYGRLKNDTLTIGNSLVERTFLWNGGNIITYRLTDKSNGKSMEEPQPYSRFQSNERFAATIKRFTQSSSRKRD